MTAQNLCWDVAWSIQKKAGQHLEGDVVLAHPIPDEARTIVILADGLGSGVKANVLANLTARMAVRFAQARRDLAIFADTIRRTLPVCQVRGISYSTFTIIDLGHDGRVDVAWYGNPPAILRQDTGKTVQIEGEIVSGKDLPGQTLCRARCQVKDTEAIIACSDGITQAGLGSPAFPLGWGLENFAEHLGSSACETASARRIALWSVNRAIWIDGGRLHDDASCVVCRRRLPVRLLVVTGPPFEPHDDVAWAQRIAAHVGPIIVSGGTTAQILARELSRELREEKNMSDPESRIPPGASMPGITLVTEGVITLKTALEALSGPVRWNNDGDSLLEQFLANLVDADEIQFLVGSGVNRAHHDPRYGRSMPDRRRLIDDLARILQDRHCKRTSIEWV